MAEVIFEDNSVAVIDALESVKEQWLDDVTRMLLNQTQQNSRVDTGQTKSSWDRKVLENEGVVGSSSQNAIWEEFGTGDYAVNGDG